jgi:hypothetical protein
MKHIGNAYKILAGRLKGKDQFGSLAYKLHHMGETEYSVLPECKPGITVNHKFI